MRKPVINSAALHVEAAIPNFIIHEHHIVNLTPAKQKASANTIISRKTVNIRYPKNRMGNELSDYVLMNALK
jgi:hypothetical protein